MLHNKIRLCLLVFSAAIFLWAGSVSAGGPLQYGLVGLLNSLGITNDPEADPFGAPVRIREKCSEGQGLTPINISAIVGNRSGLAVNLVIDGEPADSSNLYRPGETRSVTLLLPDDRVTFHAVRDGSIIASQTWSRDPGKPCSVPVVLFENTDASAILTIVTGKRSY